MSIYELSAKTMSGETAALSAYKGKVLLIVNTATGCGFTPQYEALQDIYERFADKGFVILDFPCNQFGHQAPGTDGEIVDFCQSRYGVTFPQFSKIDVNGETAHPLYKWLKSQKGGVLGDRIKWNFTKFLVDKNGAVIARYAPTTKPETIVGAIEGLL